MTTGADLKAALSNLRRVATLVCLLVVVCSAFRAQNAVPPPDLDRSIDQVIHRPAYTWRMPRPATPEASHGFLDEVARAADRALHRAGDWFGRLVDWILDKLREDSAADSRPGTLHPSQKLRWLLYSLIAVLSVAVILLVRRFLQTKRAVKPVSETAQPMPAEDLTDDRLDAGKVPEDRWIALAQECMARGEMRTALRALYLASLSYLARSNLVTVQAAKTNRQYETELRRRTRDKIDVARLFTDNARVFERSWYGDHEVSAQILEIFRDNLQRMKTSAES